MPIPDVSHEVFLSILTFLYTGKVGEVPPAMAVELLGAANLYNIEPLKRTCAEVIARPLTHSLTLALTPNHPHPHPPPLVSVALPTPHTNSPWGPLPAAKSPTARAPRMTSGAHTAGQAQ